MQIEENTIVSFRYIMKDDTGTVVENTMDGLPVNYLYGSAAILPLLQLQMKGLKPGDKKTICLPAESGFTNHDFTFEIIIDHVRKAMNEELILGYPVTTNVEKCEQNCDCYLSNE